MLIHCSARAACGPEVLGVLTIAMALFVTACSDKGPSTLTPDTQTPPPVDTVPSEATAWLRGAAVPFNTTDPNAEPSDIGFLRDMVGSAHLVEVGESTHGTRDFFLMKDRILRYLVEKMGFDAFAIEASWPEANRLDTYVRTGVGDPKSLLSGLYFWTWNTQAVLDMIEWMRAENASGVPVGFYGVDMQFPGMAIANVQKYIEATDSASSDQFSARMSCLKADANNAYGSFSRSYSSETAAYRDSCRDDLQWVYDTLEQEKDSLSARSGADAFAMALQSARVALQYEGMASGRDTRDHYMAENALWLLQDLGPGTRMMLWAHNGHVRKIDGFMGAYLSQALGDDMVAIGFAMGGGSFNAVPWNGTRVTGPLQTFTVHDVPADSYEAYFRSTGLERFALDLRSTAAENQGWLRGPRPFRSVGAVYDPSQPFQWFYSMSLTAAFDVIVYLENTTATQLLPYIPPGTFYP